MKKTPPQKPLRLARTTIACLADAALPTVAGAQGRVRTLDCPTVTCFC
jgi:hypothetical protein